MYVLHELIPVNQHHINTAWYYNSTVWTMTGIDQTQLAQQ